ncbi:MAG: septum formation initiator family protein [Clostridia bacterium]|nr:septum formation initiator family protein [Clostridia bacterium]
MKSITGNIVFKAAVILFAALCIATVVRLQLKNNGLKADTASLKEKIEEEENRVRELKSKLDAPFDEEYVIELAKEKLHLRLPDEIVFYTDN